MIEQHRASGGVAPAEALLQSVVRNAPVVLFALDGEGVFTLSEGNGLAGLGLSPGEAVGRSVFEMYAHQPETVARVRRALAGETVVWTSEYDGVYFDVHCAPVFDAQGRPSGVIGVGHDVTSRRRAEEELRRALDRESRIARVLQRPLAMPIAGDAFPGIELASRYAPVVTADAAQVGGDFVDAFALPAGRVALAAADASGKGLAAAARALQIREVLRAFAREEADDPARTLARLNDYLCDNRDLDGPDGSEGGAFVSLALAFVDPRTGEGVVAAAGAERPLVLRRAERRLEVPDVVAGLPLGVERGEDYAPAVLRLTPGDILLLLTDGITEARRGTHILGDVGLARLVMVAATEAAGGLPALADGLLTGARTFAGGVLRDDACLLLARKG